MNCSYDSNFGEEYNASLPSLGNVISDVMAFFGYKKLYGVGGDFSANLITALQDNIQIYPSSNEMHAGFSACAQAEIDGMGFCLTTYMVGSLPCTSAAALAVTESLPVIFISGAPGEDEVNDIAIHHTIQPNNSWKTQYDNALESFRALGVKAERLQGQRTSGQPNTAGERFFQLLSYAYKTKQPVFIEIPRDLVFAKTQTLKLPLSLAHIYYGNNLLAGSHLIVNKIQHELKKCKHPILYIGDRLKHNQHLKYLVLQFAEKFNIPYATSWFAKGIFDEYAPLCLGAYNGLFSQTIGKKYIENKTDYILEIANSIMPQDTNTAFGTDTHKINSFEKKTTLKSGAILEKDLIEIFEQLLKSDIESFEFTMPVEKIETIDVNEDIDFNNLAAVLNELQHQNPNPFVYLPEIGNSYFTSYGLKVRNGGVGRGWLTNPWYGAMGTALPYARTIAQKIKQQNLCDKLVVIIGDGGFHFQLNELIHLLKDRSQVTIIYMRNNIFHLGKSSNAPIYECNSQSFDVHKIVAAYQGNSVLCKTVDEFKNIFIKYINNDGINLIEILAKPIDSRQCHELRLLNLYIKSKNGIPEAIKKWQEIIS